MNTVTRFLLKLRYRIVALFGLSTKNDDLSEELEQHLELAIADGESRGLSSEEARKEALKEFGNVESLKEDCRDAWGTRVVTDLIRDVRVSIRSLRKSPGFSLAVIVTLALCIGANTTVLSALYGLILKPLPVENPERVVQLFNVRKDSNGKFYSESGWNQYVDLRGRSDLFEGCAIRMSVDRLIGRDSSFRRVRGQEISGEFFDVMGAKPLLGRFFLPEEVDPQEAKFMVLSQSAWENEYGSDPNVIGQEVLLEGEIIYTIIGVAPRSMEVFDFEARFFGSSGFCV